MTDNRRINSIDIVRLFAAILVIAIHTQAVTWFAGRPNGDIQILTRLAVPFFFCTSGYFLQKAFDREGCSAIAAVLLKTIVLYATLSLVYFTVIFLQNPSLLHESKKWMLIDFLFNGSWYHLWYLVGVIYSMIMIFLFCRIRLSRLLLPMAVVCYIIGLLGTSYYGIGSGLPGLSVLFDSGWFQSIRRIFLMGFPFTVLGWTISEGKPKITLSRKQLLRSTALIAFLFVAEIIAITCTGMSKSVVITVFLYPLIFLIFKLCLVYPLADKAGLASTCKDAANFIYYWHPIIILVLRRAIDANFPLFLATTAICLLLGYCWHSLKNRRRISHEHHANI